MADLMTIKENILEPEVSMSNVQDVRAISTTGKSVRVAKANVRYPATQISVSQAGIAATDVQAALHELDGEIDTLGTEKVDTTTEVIAGAGLTGGGTLAESRTINVVATDDSIVVAADGIKVDTVNTLESTSATKPLSAGQGKAVNDRLVLVEAGVDALAPEVDFYNRVSADGGTVRSKAFMQRVFEANKDLLADTELLYVPEAGMKVTDGKIEKLYNLVGTNDAVQATASNRPYVGGAIAPNEKEKIKHILGQTGEKSINGTSVPFLSTDSWSMVISFSINTSKQYQVIYLNGTSNLLVINYLSQYWMQNGAGIHIIDGAFNFECGKNYTLTISYINGTGFAVINEDSAAITITPLAIGFSGVGFNNTAFECDATVSYFQVLSSFLSASEIQKLHSFLSTEFPPIETIAVGSQQVATSNLEATVFGAVSVPEVQNSSAVEIITNVADRELSSDTGFWEKTGDASISSGVASFTGGGVLSGSATKWRIRKFNFLEIGKRYEFTLKAKYVSGAGNIMFGNGYIHKSAAVTSGFVTYSFTFVATSADVSIGGTDGVTFEVDDLSIVMLGWENAQFIYDARIAEGDTAAQAAIAAMMWSHYDNLAANGAIFGKLYNGYAVDTIKANAPKGYHVPSDLEWTQLSESLGGNTVSGGKLKAMYGGFDNAFATNESGVSLLAGGYRSNNGAFTMLEQGAFAWCFGNGVHPLIYADGSSIILAIYADDNPHQGFSIRLFSNTPHLTTDKYESGLFATDIASTPKSIRIPFGCKVTNIKCVTSTNVTAIEAKLFNYAGTELETLITGKACNATTKSFSVTADQSVSYTDNYVRVTATGNGGSVGMNIIVTIEPI